MSNNGIVKIHGKDYMTVARRVEVAHEAKTLEGIQTEVISHNPVVVKATVTIKGKIFTGISAVNPDSQKSIEKLNPYEVAETSAVGRALGFAGYGLIESIVSAEDIIKATGTPVQKRVYAQARLTNCTICHAPSGKQHATFCTAN